MSDSRLIGIYVCRWVVERERQKETKSKKEKRPVTSGDTLPVVLRLTSVGNL